MTSQIAIYIKKIAKIAAIFVTVMAIILFYKASRESRAKPPKIKVVWMGDSITELWAKINPTFFTLNSFINKGISGQATQQMVDRFEQDVISLHPSTVVILAGTNDIAENIKGASLETAFENIVLMSERARANDIRVILCSVLPSTRFNWNPSIHPENKIIELNQKLKQYAQKNKLTYVDYYTSMVNSEKGIQKKYADDGTHPNADGYRVMEIVAKTSLPELFQQ